MKSRWRYWLLAFAFGLILDIALAYALAAILTNEPADYFPIYAALIILLPALFSAWSAIKRWAFFPIFGKERTTREYIKALHQGGFPPPYGEYDADEYLNKTVHDEEMPIKTRLAAASLVGQIGATRLLGGLTIGLMTTISLQAAMQRYHPRPKRRESP